MRDIDLPQVLGCVAAAIACLALVAVLGWMVWADATEQCFGPAYNTYLDQCVNGHAVPR